MATRIIESGNVSQLLASRSSNPGDINKVRAGRYLLPNDAPGVSGGFRLSRQDVGTAVQPIVWEFDPGVILERQDRGATLIFSGEGENAYFRFTGAPLTLLGQMYFSLSNLAFECDLIGKEAVTDGGKFPAPDRAQDAPYPWCPKNITFGNVEISGHGEDGFDITGGRNIYLRKLHVHHGRVTDKCKILIIKNMAELIHIEELLGENCTCPYSAGFLGGMMSHGVPRWEASQVVIDRVTMKNIITPCLLTFMAAKDCYIDRVVEENCQRTYAYRNYIEACYNGAMQLASADCRINGMVIPARAANYADWPPLPAEPAPETPPTTSLAEEIATAVGAATQELAARVASLLARLDALDNRLDSIEDNLSRMSSELHYHFVGATGRAVEPLPEGPADNE